MNPTKHHFAIAASELAQGQTDAGLWAQATAQALGNKDLAFATYLRLRAEELSKEELIHSATSLAEGVKERIDRILSIAWDVVVVSFGVMAAICFLAVGIGLSFGMAPDRLGSFLGQYMLAAWGASAILVILYKALRDRW